FGKGDIFLPDNKNVMFVPQTSYMPLGSLREALVFPDKIISISDDLLIQLLRQCDLPHLTNQLDVVSRWTEHLSPGELQRIAFLRVLLHKPDWVFLDEITASLDIAREKQLYRLLKDQLPNCSV